MKLLPKAIFLACFLLLALGAKSAWAYLDNNSFEESLKSATWEKNSFDFKTINNTLETLNIAVSGPQDPELRAQLGGGALDKFASLIGTMYTHPPASTERYLAYLGENLKIVKPAYAQEEGFRALEPIMGIWKTFRDVAYVFFAIVFVIIGFAIMFRVKLNPQTVISIQNSLPKIIVALILVTFSYAIAGLVIDFTHVISAILVGIINPVGLIETIIQLVGGRLDSPDIITFQTLFMGKGLAYAWDLSKLFTDPTVFLPNLPPLFEFITDQIGEKISAGPSLLISLILGIVLLITFFRLFFTLLKAYVTVIISIIFAPLQIMLNALPGQNSFGSWLKNLVANLSVFPTVIVMLAITSKIVTSSSGKSFWLPSPLTLPLGGSPDLKPITALIGYGMLLITPKIVEIVKDALQVKSYPYGTAIGEAFGLAKPLAAGGVESAYQIGAARGGPWATGRAKGIAGTVKESIIRSITK